MTAGDVLPRSGGRRVVGLAKRAVTRMPVARHAKDVRDRRRLRRPGATTIGDVVAVATALDGIGARWCLVGGWAVDAVCGGEGRGHDDVDVALEDFETDAPRVAAALSELGFHVVVDRRIDGLWAPRVQIFEDGTGRSVELLDVDRHVVAGALGLATDRASLETTVDIAGRAIPCLAPAAQLLVHRGYPPRPADRVDVARLARAHPAAARLLVERRHHVERAVAVVHETNQRVAYDARAGMPTALVVAAPAVDRARREVGLTPDPGALPSHLTVLYPFVPAADLATVVLDDLRDVVATIPAFELSLDRIGWFGDRVVHLRADDDAFVRLSSVVHDLFPAHPPYAGTYDEFVPHVTLGEGRPLEVLRHLASAIEPVLPLRVSVTEVQLLAQTNPGGPWHVAQAFPLAPADPHG